MDTLLKLVGLIILWIVTTVVIGLLLSLPVMLLWNACLVAAIPGLQAIGWFQAWGINILCGILFKSASSNTNNA